jgi:uncharacterized protein involved in exopolysaccharide biosynthesis
MKYFFLIVFIFVYSLSIFAQTDNKKVEYSTPTSKAIKSSPAYSALILQRTIIRAELEEMLVTYTEDFPKVKDARHEIDLINFALSRLLDTKVTDSCKLSDSLGQLLIKKTAVEMELYNLKKKYKDDHPDVLRTKRKLDIYEKAVVEILP